MVSGRSSGRQLQQQQHQYCSWLLAVSSRLRSGQSAPGPAKYSAQDCRCTSAIRRREQARTTSTGLYNSHRCAGLPDRWRGTTECRGVLLAPVVAGHAACRELNDSGGRATAEQTGLGWLWWLQEKRIKTEIESLERDKGVKLRVLAQNYPNTPGATSMATNEGKCLYAAAAWVSMLPLNGCSCILTCVLTVSLPFLSGMREVAGAKMQPLSAFRAGHQGLLESRCQHCCFCGRPQPGQHSQLQCECNCCDAALAEARPLLPPVHLHQALQHRHLLIEGTCLWPCPAVGELAAAGATGAPTMHMSTQQTSRACAPAFAGRRGP